MTHLEQVECTDRDKKPTLRRWRHVNAPRCLRARQQTLQVVGGPSLATGRPSKYSTQAALCVRIFAARRFTWLANVQQALHHSTMLEKPTETLPLLGAHREFAVDVMLRTRVAQPSALVFRAITFRHQ